MSGATRYHHGDLRNALIEAAVPLLETNGPAGLSLREVARAAGVSHAAPYRHFRDRTELLEEIAARGYQRLSRACERARRRFPDAPDRQLVEAGIGYLMFVVERPNVAHLMFGGQIGLDTCGDVLRSAADEAFGSLAAIVDAGVQAGTFRQEPVHELTIAAWSLVHGLATLIASGMLRAVAGKPREVRRLGRRLAQTLLDGMCA